MFRNMVTSLFRHGRITTTVTRAKELRRLADKMVTLAKDGSLHARRQAMSVIMDKAVVAKLFDEIEEQMAGRKGGYTRIVRIGPRRGDGAMMCIIELVKESLRPAKRSRKAKAHEAAAPTVIPQAPSDVPEQPAEEKTLEEAEPAAGQPAHEEEAAGGIQEEKALEAEGQEPSAEDATGELSRPEEAMAAEEAQEVPEETGQGAEAAPAEKNSAEAQGKDAEDADKPSEGEKKDA